MSYDVSIEVSGMTHSVFSENFTSNCSALWTDALQLPEQPSYYADTKKPVMVSRLNPGTDEWELVHHFEKGLKLLDGVPCHEAARTLDLAVRRAHSWTLEKIASYSAPNGWGTGIEALEFLEKISRAAQAFPDGILHIVN